MASRFSYAELGSNDFYSGIGFVLHYVRLCQVAIYTLGLFGHYPFRLPKVFRFILVVGGPTYNDRNGKAIVVISHSAI